MALVACATMAGVRSQTMTDQLAHYAAKLAYEIDAWDLQVALDAGEAITLVDTRTPEALAREHIPGAISLPHRLMNADTTAQIDKGALVVTYCDGVGCNGSTKGALNLAKLGFRVKELVGGLDWWKRDGHRTHAHAEAGPLVKCGCS